MQRIVTEMGDGELGRHVEAFLPQIAACWRVRVSADSAAAEAPIAGCCEQLGVDLSRSVEGTDPPAAPV